MENDKKVKKRKLKVSAGNVKEWNAQTLPNGAS